VDDLLRDRQDLGRASRRAGRVKTRIPDVPAGMAWMEAYGRGRLARFHQDFDAGPQMPREAWPYTYDSLDLRTLPACARLALRLFCGAIADGLEDPAAFTCESQALRGVCPSGGCGWDLGSLRPAVG
jgi:hypothetical protein